VNRIDTLERDLTLWFADTAAPRTPDYVDDIVREVARVSQRPGWAIPERWIPMSVTTFDARGATRPFPWRAIALLSALALVAVSLLAVYVGSRPTVPPPFGLAANGRIAFGSDGDIFSVDPATGETSTLVSGATFDDYPNYSPDGTLIEFERRTADGAQVFVIAAGGGEERLLTPTVFGGVLGPTWSPDSSELMFIDDARSGLVVLPIDGGRERRIDLDVAMRGFPKWRPPAGGDILFLGADGSDIGWFLVKPDGSELRRVTLGDGSIMNDAVVQWAPDGERLIGARGEGGPLNNERFRLHVMTVADDGRVTADTVVGPPMLAGDNTPVGYMVSPDGTHLTAPIVQGKDQSRWRMGVFATDGSGTVIETGPVFVKYRYAYGWSPDGTVIVVKDVDAHETWLLDAAGGPERQAPWTDFTDDLPAWQRSAR
jgi:hypothetical protein